MKNLSFETHRYAPELIKVFLKGLPFDAVKADQMNKDGNPTTYKDCVKAFRKNSKFKKPSDDFGQRYVKVKKVYEQQEHQWLNKTLQGHFKQTQEVLKVIDRLYERQSVLLDGSILPEPKILISYAKHGGDWHDITTLARERFNDGKSHKSKLKPLSWD